MVSLASLQRLCQLLLSGLKFDPEVGQKNLFLFHTKLCVYLHQKSPRRGNFGLNVAMYVTGGPGISVKLAGLKR